MVATQKKNRYQNDLRDQGFYAKKKLLGHRSKGFKPRIRLGTASLADSRYLAEVLNMEEDKVNRLEVTGTVAIEVDYRVYLKYMAPTTSGSHQTEASGADDPLGIVQNPTAQVMLGALAQQGHLPTARAEPGQSTILKSATGQAMSEQFYVAGSSGIAAKDEETRKRKLEKRQKQKKKAIAEGKGDEKYASTQQKE